MTIKRKKNKMTIKKKLFGTVAAGIAVTVALTGCAGGSTTADSGQEIMDVRFGYIPDFNGASLLAIAEDQGLFDKYNLDVTTSTFTNGPLQIQALGAGDLDFGNIGPGALWLPASGESRVVSVAILGGGDRVIAQPGINSIRDLAGKRIGVPEGTSGDMILTLALKAEGMTKDDVEIFPMDPGTLVSAFSAGQIDAAGIWYPHVTTIKQQVPNLTELVKNSDFADIVSFPCAIIARNVVVDENPEMVSRLLGALKEAMDYRKSNPEKTVELVAAMLDLPLDVVNADAENYTILDSGELEVLTEDGSVARWFSSLNEYFEGAGKVSNPLDPSEYYTADLFVSAGE